MRGAVLYGPRDVRFEERRTPAIIQPTDAIVRTSATCVCGSDLWPYRGISPVTQPTPMGHEYCGIVEEVGSDVTTIKPGQFVIGSFFASDNTCPHCKAGYQTSCEHKEFIRDAQAQAAARPARRRHLGGNPGGSLQRHDPEPADALRRHGRRMDHRDEPSRVAAEACPRVRRDRHRDRARRRGCRPHQGTDPWYRCGLSAGVRRHAGVDDAGDPLHPSRRVVGYVGVPHGVALDGEKLFYAHVHLHGGPAPVRRVLPELIDLVWKGKIKPGKVFDLSLPLEQVAEGYRAMDERRAIKTLLRP